MKQGAASGPFLTAMRFILCLSMFGVLTAAELTPVESARAQFVQSLSGSPVLLAARDRVVAAHAAARATGRLPDPTLGGGYARKSTTGNEWPIYEVNLEQALPRWGERDASRAMAAAEVSLSEAERLESVGDAAAEVALMLADAQAARALLVVTEREMARVQSLRSAVNARVAVGSGTLAEGLGLQTRHATLVVERDSLQREVDDAEQEARALLALPPESPLPPLSVPDRALVMVERVPGMLAAKAKQAAAAAEFSAAHASRNPETAIGLRYEHEPEPGNPSDTIGVELRVSLPVWQGSSGELENAAAARSRAALRESLGWHHRAQALIGRSERAATVAARARQAADEARVRIDAEYETLMRQVATEDGPTVTIVLSVLDRLSEAERQVITAETTARQAEARLWRLAPPDVSLVPEASNPRDRTTP